MKISSIFYILVELVSFAVLAFLFWWASDVMPKFQHNEETGWLLLSIFVWLVCLLGFYFVMGVMEFHGMLIALIGVVFLLILSFGTVLMALGVVAVFIFIAGIGQIATIMRE